MKILLSFLFAIMISAHAHADTPKQTPPAHPPAAKTAKADKTAPETHAHHVTIKRKVYHVHKRRHAHQKP